MEEDSVVGAVLGQDVRDWIGSANGTVAEQKSFGCLRLRAIP